MIDQYLKLGQSLEWKKKLIYAGIFIQENKLHAVYDRYNKMSCKQWLLLAVLSGFDENPDLSTVAQAMGCSRQNVKKLALKLESDGYIKLYKSDVDGRGLYIERTKMCKEVYLEIEELGHKVHENIFRDFTDEEIEQYFSLSMKLLNGIEYLDDFFRKQKEDEKSKY